MIRPHVRRVETLSAPHARSRRGAGMTPVEIALYVLIATSGLLAFVHFILLGTNYASPVRFGACLIAFGVSLFLALSYYQLRLVLFGERTEGVVTDVVPRRKAYRPVVRFVAKDGQEVEFRCRQGVQQDTYAVGQSVPVYYLASDPTFAIVASRQSLWQPLVFVTPFFFLPLVGGGVLVYKQSVRR
jgi:hypothetical protein